MSSVNKVIIIGNLGADPELRYTSSNTAVCTLRVATTEKWTDKSSGEKKENTEWHRVIIWGRQGENAQKYLSKGRSVYVEGRLQTQEWTDRDNNKRWTTQIVATNVVFLSGGGESRGGGYDPPAPSGLPPGDEQFSDDSIPF